MSSVNDTTNAGHAYWRSLDELADTPEFREFVHNEFPSSATELLDAGDRRQFLKIMGAGMALAGLGLAGCRRWPEQYVAPYASRPADRVPGKPEFFATSMERGGVSYGLLATSHEGRPTKIDGNPDHPTAMGKSDSYTQASVLDLYDPDRSRFVLSNDAASTYAAFGRWIGGAGARLHQGDGLGLAVLSEATSSPSVSALRDKLRASSAFPEMMWVEYEPLANDEELIGTFRAFGDAAFRPRYDLSKADVIVSFDADILGDHPDMIEMTRGYAANRRADNNAKTMSRLYCFENAMTLTGANADERVALRSAQVLASITWLAAKCAGDAAGMTAAEAVLSERAKTALAHAYEDLSSHTGHGVVVVGRNVSRFAHTLAHGINENFENHGATVSYRPLERAQAGRHVESLRALVDRMNAGEVDTLVVLGGNPVFNAPADLDFAGALARVKNVIHVADYVDETWTTRRSAAPAGAQDWHINRAHYLECWGDGLAADGTYTLQQPLILPLFDGKSVIEVLATLAGDEMTDGQELVRRTYHDAAGNTSDKAWRTALHAGFVANSAGEGERPGVLRQATTQAMANIMPLLQTATDGWEVRFVTDGKVYDGRYANNGWLQELPQPITKLTWDNAAAMNVASAEALGVKVGDLVTIDVDGRSIEMPVIVVPGVADRSIMLPVGYGRGMKGRICDGAGRNVYAVRSSTAMWNANATVRKAVGTYPLATTQDHHAIEVDSVGGKGIQNRLAALVRQGTLDEYRDHPNFAKHRTHVVHRLSLWDDDHAIEGSTYKWAMAIDLSTCTGCSACVVACQAENNIAIVGKDQVLRGREMHWIRIDRYYRFAETGDQEYDANALEAVALQPVMCMHCENAPCEQVCPVAATVHDKEGLNVMVYNRCIGTRYCSNNCPYKVRRFNYFDYHRRETPRDQPGALLQVDPEYYTKAQADPGVLKSMQFNPEVTVRMRGIMEKCTYCTQRIQAAKIEAKNAWTKDSDDEKRTTDRIGIPDGVITPACAQACPAEALVFGDLNDSSSRVRALHRHERSYELLEELNVDARTKYLAKLRNPKDGAGHATGGGHGDAPSAGHGEGHDHG
jgi:molybdopterin-containing oxidoreductase family iron-sulfur binding subunit